MQKASWIPLRIPPGKVKSEEETSLVGMDIPGLTGLEVMTDVIDLDVMTEDELYMVATPSCV
jgi:hypothetical protein